MRPRSLHRCCGCVLAALLLSLTHGARAGAAERPAATAPSPAAMAEYRRKLEEYTLARGKYEAEADAYWGSITDKRKLRRAKRRNNQDIVLGDYVLTQPAVRFGPAETGRSVGAARGGAAKEVRAGRGRLFAGSGEGIQFCSAAASQRDGVQTRLRQCRFRRGADEGAGGANLCLRVRR